MKTKDRQKNTRAEREYLVMVTNYENRMMNFRGQSEKKGKTWGKIRRKGGVRMIRKIGRMDYRWEKKDGVI